MTFKIGGVLVAVFATSLLCTLGTSAKAETGAGDGKVQSVSASRNHRAEAKHQLHKETAALPAGTSQGAPKPPYREVFWQPFGWGAPPLQDSRDAYQGYFANPVDNPRSFGSVGRATLIFRQ
jgi:hypothetical protein